MKRVLIAILLLMSFIATSAQILFSDYSDPDVCKGRDGGYWLTASSFQCSPGLPILYSENLSDWQLVNYAIDNVPIPEGESRKCTFEGGRSQAGDGVPHGCGVWAPSIRLHDGTYYIYWGDPDYGVRVYSFGLPQGYTNCWEVPNLFLKKFEGETFADTLHLVITATSEGQESGVIVMGRDYCRLSAMLMDGSFHLRQVTCRNADKGSDEMPPADIAVIPARKYNAGARENYECRLSVIVRCAKGGKCSFAYSVGGGEPYTSLPTTFAAREGRWIGAKYGIFSLSPDTSRKGWCDLTINRTPLKEKQ